MRPSIVGAFFAVGIAGALFADQVAGAFDREVATVHLSSPVVGEHARLPLRFTGAGEGISPPLAWSGMPSDTKSLVLIVADLGDDRVRWLVYDIPPVRTGFGSDTAPADARVGLNDAGRRRYEPPCSPTSVSTHAVFTIHALDRRLDIDDADASRIREVMADHVLASGSMVVECEAAPE